MSKLKNHNAAHDVPPEDYLHIRCRSDHKQEWRDAAEREGASLSRWVIDRLNGVSQPFTVGDIVAPLIPDSLYSGAGQYIHAVVVRIDPFAITSEHGGMLWTNDIKPKNFVVVGRVTNPEQLQACLRRVDADL